MLCIAIIVILMTISLKVIHDLETKARNLRAIVEIKQIQTAIDIYFEDYRELPASLADLNSGSVEDPWGTPYNYSNFTLVKKGQWRKDRSLHPLNTTYDLWSNGKDRKSVTPLTAAISHDDIIRGNDGDYVGLALGY